MVKPRIIVRVGGGLVQEIITDQDVKILLIDEDVSEEPGPDNHVLILDGTPVEAIIYQYEMDSRKVDILFGACKQQVLAKEGWVDLE